MSYCKTFNKQVPIATIDHDQAEYVYAYLNEYKKIRSTINEEVVVPKIQFLKDSIENKVYTTITWNQGLPILIPKCDFVIVLKETKSFFGIIKKQKPSIIDYQTIMSSFSQLLEPINHPISHLNLLSLENNEKVKEIFNTLFETTYEDLESIESDDFVDFNLN